MLIENIVRRPEAAGFDAQEVEAIAKKEGILTFTSKNNPDVHESRLARLWDVLEAYRLSKESMEKTDASFPKGKEHVEKPESSAPEGKRRHREEPRREEKRREADAFSGVDGPDSRRQHELLSWEDAAKGSASKGGGVGIIGLRGNGKTCLLKTLLASSRNQSVWRLGKVCDKWRAVVQGRTEKTSETEYAELNGTLFGPDNGRLPLRTVEVSGEAWRQVFLPDERIVARAQLAAAISELRRFICSCDGFLFLIDAALTIGEEELGEFYGAAEQDMGVYERSSTRFHEEVKDLWSHLLHRLAIQDSTDGMKVTRPVAVVFTKADFCNHQRFPGLEENFFLLRELCEAHRAHEYKQLRDNQEKHEARRARAMDFLAGNYSEISDDLISGGTLLEQGEVFAISCVGVLGNRDRGVRSACFEEPVDWMAERVWKRKSALEKEQCREAYRAKRKKAIRRIKTAIAAMLVLLIGTVVGLGFLASRKIEQMALSLQEENLLAYAESFYIARANPVFVLSSHVNLLSALCIERTRLSVQGAGFVEREVRVAIERHDYDAAWEAWDLLREHREFLGQMPNGPLAELGRDLLAAECLALVGSGDAVAADRSLTRGIDRLLSLGVEKETVSGFLAHRWVEGLLDRAQTEPSSASSMLRLLPSALKDRLEPDQLWQVEVAIQLKSIMQCVRGHAFAEARVGLENLQRSEIPMQWRREVAEKLEHVVREGVAHGKIGPALALIDDLGTDNGIGSSLISSRMLLMGERILHSLKSGALRQAALDLKSLGDLDPEVAPWRASLEELVQKLEEMCYIPASGNVSPFYIDRDEVSVMRFRRFMDSEARIFPGQRKSVLENLWKTHCMGNDAPAVGMTWGEADAYAAFHGKRLPTVAEWRVAFGATRYSWGDEWGVGRCNTRETGVGKALPPTHHLVRNDRTLLGVRGLSGNVSEWTSTTDGQGYRVAAGGNFLFDRTSAQRDGTMKRSEKEGFFYIGMRCVVGTDQIERLGRTLIFGE